MDRLRRAIRGLGPIDVAVALALISIPATVLAMPAYDASMPTTPYNQAGWPHAPLLDPGVLSSTMTSVLVAALVSSALWGKVTGAHPFLGAIAVFVTAWLVGMVMLPVFPTLLHQPLAIGALCIDSCSAVIRSGDLESGLDMITTPWLLLFGPLAAPGVFLILAVGVAIWTRLVRSSAREPQSPGVPVVPPGP